MNDTLIRLLDSNLAIDVRETIKNYQKRLSVKEYVVLVAGMCVFVLVIVNIEMYIIAD